MTPHVITVETRLVEPQADGDGRLWECYEPSGAVACSCGAAWTLEDGPPDDHKNSL